MSEKIDWSSASPEQISEKVRTIISKNFSQNKQQAEYLEKNNDEQAKFAEMGLDSLDIAEFSMALEDTFSLPEIEEKDLKEMATIQDVVRYIITKKQPSAAPAA